MDVARGLRYKNKDGKSNNSNQFWNLETMIGRPFGDELWGYYRMCNVQYYAKSSCMNWLK